MAMVGVCPICGYRNPPHRSACERCGTLLFQPTQPAPEVVTPEDELAPPERPGCVTAYALVNGVGGTLVGLLLLFGQFGALGGVGGVFTGVLVIAFSVFIGWGLWRMKRVARLLVLILLGLGVVQNLYSAYALLTHPSASEYRADAYALIAGAVVSSLIFYWFLRNGQLFRG